MRAHPRRTGCTLVMFRARHRCAVGRDGRFRCHMTYGEATVTAMLRVLARATEDPGAIVVVDSCNPAQRERLQRWLRAVHGAERRVEPGPAAGGGASVVQVRLPARMWWPTPR